MPPGSGKPTIEPRRLPDPSPSHPEPTPMPDPDRPAAPEPSEAVPTFPSLPVRALQVVVAPIRLFEALRHRPVFWGALLLAALLTALGTAVIPASVWENSIRTQLMAAGQEVPAELGTMLTLTRVMGSIGPVVALPIMAFAGAGLFSLLFLFGMGYEGSYGRILSVTAHALLFLGIAGLLLTPARILSGNLQFTLSIGSLLPFFGDGLVGRFLNLLDLFGLWAAALIGMGAATMDGQRSPASGALVSLGAVLLLLLLVAGVFGAGAPPI